MRLFYSRSRIGQVPGVGDTSTVGSEKDTHTSTPHTRHHMCNQSSGTTTGTATLPTLSHAIERLDELDTVSTRTHLHVDRCRCS